MRKIIKVAAVALCILLLVFGAVFGLAKKKVIFINEWFVNEANSTVGVDLSAYQADVDFRQLKQQGVAFAYVKATEGSAHQDERFPENWEKAAAAGLPCGAYHFFSYDSPGATQAENFIAAVGPDLSGRLLPVVDVEYYGDTEENPPDKDDVIRELSAFMEAVAAEYGVEPMIYTRSDIYKTYLEGAFDSCKFWMSSLYTPLNWNYRGDWYLWQYLNRGLLEGVSGGEKYIDLNVLNPEKSLDELTVR